MFEITTTESQAITNILLDAEIKIQAIIKQPCAVMLTSPRVVLARGDMNDFFKTVLNAIEKHTGVNLGSLKSCSREVPIVRARHIAFKLMYESGYQPSYKQVARLFNRDHSTVIHGIQSISNDIKNISSYANLYTSIKNELNNQQ
jgi:chromosomal replication initiation ATPase DnaA